MHQSTRYLRCLRPLIFEIDVGSKVVVVVVSMNRHRPPIESSSTHRVTQGRRPTIQTMITFVGEHNYEQPHTNDGILDIEGQCPTKRIVTKRSR
jgi:hypothetical protein